MRNRRSSTKPSSFCSRSTRKSAESCRPQAPLTSSGLGGGQLFVLGLEFFAGFAPLRVEGDAGDRAQGHALWFVEVADAFGALVRVDLVELRAHRDGVVRALGLAHVAIDAVVGNQQSHLY